MTREYGGGDGQGAGWDAAGVRDLRAHLALSQAELAARLGTRQQTISEWETDARAPRPMSRRLLHLLAESEGFYRTRRNAGAAPYDDAAGIDPPHRERTS